MIHSSSLKKVFLFLALTFCFVNITYGQSNLLSEKAQISLLTCGTGDELYSLYGHTALRINDPVNQIDIVYNYGAFDFDTQNFYGKFVKGDLEYFVATSSFEEFNYSYVYDNRDIFEQKLNLTQEQKQKIFSELGNVLSSEKRYYTYKFIDRNCTTMVRDVINNVLTTPISTKIPDTQKNYRKILYDYQTNKFYENLGINLMFGAKTDRQSDQLFLPVELLEGVNKSTNKGLPLTNGTITIYKKQDRNESKSLWNSFYTFAFIMLLIAFGAYKKKSIAITYLSIAGVLGLFFSLVGLYSFHEEVLWNYNVLLFSPLYIPLIWLVVMKKSLWTNRLVMVSFGLIAVYTLYMSNKAHFVMMLPIVLTTSVALLKVRNLRSES
jgi:uncharacterized protein DUF4105